MLKEKFLLKNYFCGNYKRKIIKEDMKKRLFVLYAIVLAFYACDTANEKSESPFEINAEITGVDDSSIIYLMMVKDDKLEAVDSAKIVSSRVSFKGDLEIPEMIYLKIGDSRKMINIFGESSSISIKADINDLNNVEVKGSGTHDDLIAFQELMKPIDEKSNKLREEYRAAAAISDSQIMNELTQKYEGIRLEQVARIKEFVTTKNESFISPFIILRYLSYEMDYPELDSLLSGLSSSIHPSEDYQALDQRVNTLKSVAVGNPAVDFALNDTTGNPIAISSFKGNYLLIDFWASWCAPCRHENPNVVNLYNDFKGKGFEIIGVSFDESRSKWIDAIHQDQLTWPHVSDLKGWSSAAGKLYAVSSIPATVLLNREGTIIAKNLRGDALRKKLEELYAAEDQNI